MKNKLGLISLLFLATAFDTPSPIAAVVPKGAAALPPAACQLRYYGGRVLENVVVYQVNWGSGVNATVSSGLPGFYTAVTASAYFDWLSEYNTVGLTGFSDGQPGSNQGISRGSFGGTYTITPSTGATSITDAQISAELVAQINAGNLPQPNLSADGQVNAIYMFDFPFGMTITNGGSTSCVQFCAYHGTATWNGKHVPYGVHPDIVNPSSGCFGLCGNSATQFNNATSVHSHELIEAVTDMEIGGVQTVGRPLAWYATAANCGEIGDICNAQQGTIGAYTVQKEWSNAAGACIVSKAVLPTICTGPNTPVGCRVCTGADNGIGCNGATPYCETTASNVKYGTCVACVTNGQCSGSTPICGKSATAASDDICRACVAGDCSGTTPACESTGTFTGQCVQCTSGNSSACMGTTGVCDLALDHCVQCLVNNDCMPIDQCHSASCNGGHTCVNTALTGTACTDNNACTTGDQCQSGVCMAGTPTICTALDQCHVAGTCNTTSGVCSQPAANDGTTCSDSDACTTADTCMTGMCMGGPPPTCPAGDECNDPATCSMVSGCGSVTPKADGTPCSSGHCMSGACVAPPDMTTAQADMTMAAHDLATSADDMTSGDSDLGTVSGDDLSTGGGHSSGGCGCDVTHDASPPLVPMLALSALVLLLRLRRRRDGILDKRAPIE